MGEVDIPKYCIFIGHGILQHAGAGWNGSISLHHHSYLIQRIVILEDSVAFVHGASLRRDNTFSKTYIVLGNATGVRFENDASQHLTDDGGYECSDNIALMIQT